MSAYWRPLAQSGGVRPDGALPLAGGSSWFTHIEALSRTEPSRVIPASDVPPVALERLTAPRAAISGLSLDVPRIMAIVNVTPDSFSDGGVHFDPETAQTACRQMVEAGADILDIGGESTRPGASFIPVELEVARVAPVLSALKDAGVVLSIDTRKAEVARVALDAGAGLVNDVSGFTFDEALAPLCARAEAPVCVMHSQGDPETMQNDPQYDDVLLDVFDWLSDRIGRLEAQGIPRDRILADPGIGFGKTLEHNLALLRGLSLFHGLGCGLLLGVSRKGFIGRIGKEPQAAARAPGSIAVGLAAIAQGVQILRVHDVAETAQAVRLWQAVAQQA